MAYNPIGEGLAGLGQGLGQALGQQRQEGVLKGLLQGARSGDEAALYELATRNPQAAQFLQSNQQNGQQEKLKNVGILANTALGITDPAKRRAYLIQRMNSEQDPDIKAELADTLNMDDDQMVYDLQEAVTHAGLTGRENSVQSTVTGSDGVYAVMKDGTTKNLGIAPQDKVSEFEQKLRMAGIDPETPEGQAAVRQYLMKPQTQVTVGGDKRETKFNETVGKGYGEMFLDLQKTAVQSRTNNVRLQRAEQLVDQLNTGTTQPTVQGMKRLAKSMGADLEALGVTDDTAPAEALQALGIQFALDAVAATKGAVSDKEMAMFEQSAPGLARTPQGNKLIIEMAKRMNDLNIQQAALARDYIRQNGGVLDEGYYDALDRFHAENPLFTEDLQERMATIQQSGVMAPGAADRPTATNPQTGEKLQWNPDRGQWEPM